MGPITIAFGIGLILVGVIGYVATDAVSLTALIPSAFGLVLAILGALAWRDIARKHVMHAAAMLELLGFLLTAGRIGMVLAKGEIKSQAALIENAVMAVTCLLFVGLCVKSFIDARRRREVGQDSNPGA